MPAKPGHRGRTALAARRPPPRWPWSLTVDRAERDALRRLAAGCGHTHVEYQLV
ncbi:hypothetical protein [Streptomyces sp. Ac-502]|uniref:hypothetical protein n=1 Tax=Streptomyces sp. Ac-502 TaxID=3342801 RepID=UPI0038628395